MLNFTFFRRRLYSAAKLAKGGRPNARFDTSDIVQESALQLWNESNEQHSEKEYNHSYLQKVAYGNLNRILRDNLAQKRSLRSEEHSVELDSLPSSHSQPDLIAESRDTGLDLVNRISKLSQEMQTILYMRFFDQRTFGVIAKELNRSEDVVRQRYLSALKLLKLSLESAS